LANSKQADLIGSKVIKGLKQVSSGQDLRFFGYGGKYMAQEGFENDFKIDLDQLMDKTFFTYRKSKTLNEDVFFRWNPFNLVNKHYTRGTNQVYEMLKEKDVAKKIYQSRPSLVLNIDNEYLTMQLMEEFKKYYKNSPLTMPQRHFFTRFARDLKEFSRQYVDYAHYTVPLMTANTNGFQFPGEYIGQYGVFDATKHVYQKTSSMQNLIQDDSILVNKRYFSSDMEKAIGQIRTQFRTEN